jgi:hypothetical protein
LAEELRKLDRMHEIVRTANEPSMFDQPRNAELAEVAKRTFQTADGTSSPYLTVEEVRYLQLSHGTLDPQERAEVESHVAKTHHFLKRIPWTDDLRNLVTYASGHHEKLNGSGYPKQLKNTDIPLQTRMITLADVFDALTASDRPYKPAVTPERALEIMRAEADAGLLDRDLVDIMAEGQVYKDLSDED